MQSFPITGEAKDGNYPCVRHASTISALFTLPPYASTHPPPFQTRTNQRHAAPFSTAIADMGVKTLHTPILVFYWQRAEQHRRENDVEQQRTAEVPTHAGGDPASRPTYICEHVPFVMRTREDMVRVNLVRQRSTLRAP